MQTRHERALTPTVNRRKARTMRAVLLGTVPGVCGVCALPEPALALTPGLRSYVR